MLREEAALEGGGGVCLLVCFMNKRWYQTDLAIGRRERLSLVIRQRVEIEEEPSVFLVMATVGVVARIAHRTVNSGILEQLATTERQAAHWRVIYSKMEHNNSDASQTRLSSGDSEKNDFGRPKLKESTTFFLLRIPEEQENLREPHTFC